MPDFFHIKGVEAAASETLWHLGYATAVPFLFPLID
jgi:hypothetical protein